MILIRVAIAMAIFAALLVVPPIVQGAVLTHPTGTVAPVGTKLLARNVAHAATSLTVTMQTNLGNLECETGEQTGELTKNSGGIVEEEITTIEYRGKANQTPHGPTCTGGFGGDTTVTPNHTTNPCQPGGGCSLPRCLKSGPEDTFTVRGGGCGEPARSLMFRLDTTTLGSCTYERSVATGPLVGIYTTHPADTILTLSNQIYKRVAGSVFCPIEGAIRMAFTLTADKEGVAGEPVYLDP